MSRYKAKPKTKTVQCTSCGRDMTVGWKTRTPKRCGYCAVKAMSEQQTQMAQKHGPYYDEWNDAMIEYWTQKSRGREGSPKNIDPS